MGESCVDESTSFFGWQRWARKLASKPPSRKLGSIFNQISTLIKFLATASLETSSRNNFLRFAGSALFISESHILRPSNLADVLLVGIRWLTFFFHCRSFFLMERRKKTLNNDWKIKPKLWFSKKQLGLSENWTPDLSHPKRESYH